MLFEELSSGYYKLYHQFCPAPSDDVNVEPKHTTTFVLGYCLGLSVAYVAALYIIVPSNVRRNLSRDHPLHIKWRSFSSMVVSVVAIATYPIIFCIVDDTSDTADLVEAVTSNLRYTIGILVHTMALYLGPITAALTRVYELRKRKLQGGMKSRLSYPQDAIDQCLNPTWISFCKPSTLEEKWVNIRNYFVAPLTEEIVFRGCIVPALLLLSPSILSPVQVSLVAPLFFGIAHIHHAATKLLNGDHPIQVLAVTIFQFVYTTLFGWYVSWAFIKTGSLLAVTLCHSYCNWMQLPDIRFVFQSHHPLQKYRIILMVAYMIGIVLFKLMFQVEMIFPNPSVLLTNQ